MARNDSNWAGKTAGGHEGKGGALLRGEPQKKKNIPIKTAGEFGPRYRHERPDPRGARNERHPARRSRALGNAGGVAARLAPELRLSQRAHSHPRAYGAVSPGDRRSDRHRREGDVQFHRRAEQGVPYSAPRGYGFGRTRGGRAQLALRRGAASVLHRSHVPSRKAAEGAEPAGSPGWSR